MYAKLFTSIYQGTLRGNSHGLLVFTNLLAHCDKEGIADIHPRAIAEEVGLTVEEVKSALLGLEAPDEESRTPAEGGRRIIRTDAHRAWGWEVVNYAKYRAIRNEEDRREQNRLSQERFRQKSKQSKPASANVSQDQPQKAHTEAEVDTEVEGNTPPNPRKRGKSAGPTELPCPYQDLVDAYHEALPTLPSVRLMPEARQKGMRKVWGWVLSSCRPDGTRRATTADEALQWFRDYFERASHNDFLMGRTPRSGEHKDWRCDLDFLLSDKGMKQVIEKTQEAA